jgi:hypothetical protein
VALFNVGFNEEKLFAPTADEITSLFEKWIPDVNWHDTPKGSVIVLNPAVFSRLGSGTAKTWKEVENWLLANDYHLEKLSGAYCQPLPANSTTIYQYFFVKNGKKPGKKNKSILSISIN